MSGDPLRDAFRARLETITGLTTGGAAGVSGPFAGFKLIDTVNTADEPDANTSFLSLRFGLPQEQPFSFGSPGANQWRETGDAFVDIFVRLGTGHDGAETAALAIRNAFRALAPGSSFTLGTGQRIKVMSVTPVHGGPLDGAWWVETITVGYRVTNIG